MSDANIEIWKGLKVKSRPSNVKNWNRESAPHTSVYQFKGQTYSQSSILLLAIIECSTAEGPTPILYFHFRSDYILFLLTWHPIL